MTSFVSVGITRRFVAMGRFHHRVREDTEKLCDLCGSVVKDSSTERRHFAACTRRSMTRRAERRVLELAIEPDRAQHQASAGHVSQTGKRAWKSEALAEDRHQQVYVFTGRHASE